MALQRRPLGFLGSLAFLLPLLALSGAGWALGVPWTAPVGASVALGLAALAARRRWGLAARYLEFLGSLWFLIPLLILMALVLMVVTTPLMDRWGLDFTSGALRKDFYAPVFNVLLGFLAVNLVTCTLKRKPYQVWMWGFLCTHAGVFTVMVGSFLSYNVKRYGQMPIPQGESRQRYYEEDVRELVVESRNRGGPHHRFLFEENLYRPSLPMRKFFVDEHDLTLVVERYLPHVEYQPPAFPDYEEGGPEGSPSMAQIELYWEGELSGSEWAEDGRPVRIAGSPLNVVYQEATEEHARAFLQPIGARGNLTVASGSDRVVVDVEGQMGQTVRSGGLEVTLLEYLPAYRFNDLGEVVREEEGGRPAVLFEVRRGDRAERYYVFDEHPEIALRAGALRERGDFSVLYRKRLTQSAAIFLRTGSGWHYLFTSRRGEAASGSFEPGQKLVYPFMPVRLELNVARHLRRADLVVRPREMQQGDPAHNPAVFVRLQSGAQESWGWLPFGQPREFHLGERTVRVLYGPREEDCWGLELRLVQFRKVDHPGTTDARAYESDVELVDRRRGVTQTATVSVNHPLVYRGIVFYQAAYRFDGDTPVSIFQVSYDPGKHWVYLGVIITVSGAIYMFYLRKLFIRLMQGMQGASDPPLTGLGQLGFLVLGTAGTLAAFVLYGFAKMPLLAVVAVALFGSALGVAAELLLAAGWSSERPGRPLGPPMLRLAASTAVLYFFLHLLRLPALEITLVAAGILATGAVLIYLAARPVLEARPGRAAQLGQIAACSWLMNTAGLIVLLLAGAA